MILAHATLHTAKSALATETPRSLHFFKMRFVVSSLNGMVGTIVRRDLPFTVERGNVCPPCMSAYKVRVGPGESHDDKKRTISFAWLFSKSTRPATRRNLLSAVAGRRSSSECGRTLQLSVGRDPQRAVHSAESVS